MQVIQVFEGDGFDHGTPTRVRISCDYTLNNNDQHLLKMPDDRARSFHHAVKHLYLGRHIHLMIVTPEKETEKAGMITEVELLNGAVRLRWQS